jgi:tetratricopeptide (TPR) repeat protein
MKPKTAAIIAAATTSENKAATQAKTLLAQCCEVRKNNAQKWNEIINDLDAIFPLVANRTLQTKILFEKAHYYYMAKGAFQLSIELCYEAKKLFHSNEIDFEITFQSLLGTNFHLMGNYEKAQPHYLSGIELLESKLEKSTDDLDALAKLYYNTGLLHTNLINKQSSINYVEKALEIYTQINSKSGLARCYNALGHHHPQSQQSEKISIEYYLKAAQYFEEDNDLIGLATAYNNIGYKYGMLKQIESALEYLEQSIAIRKKLGNKKGMAASFFYMGSVLESNEMYDEAIIHYQHAEKLLLEINSKHELHSLYFQLSKTFAHKSNFKQAYHYHQLYTKLKEEIFKFDYKTSLSIEASKLLIEQQEREATFERQKQQELSEYIQKLETVQNELMQMVYIASHDFREPIRMITSYSLLLSKEENLQTKIQNNAANEICNTTINMWNTLKKLQQSAQNKVIKNREK